MQPAARITVNGSDVTDKWGKVLSSVTITDEAGVKADTCEIEFDNREGFSAPKIGAELEVWLGYEPEPKIMGKYKIDSWTKRGPAKVLTISGKSADLTSKIRAPRTQSFHDKPVKQIVDGIAGDNGLSAQVDATIGARHIDHIDQHRESDVAFLTRLASRHGATFKLADGKILFAAKGSKQAPSGKAKEAIQLIPARVSTWEVTADMRGDYKSASAEYIDPTTKKRKHVKVGEGEPRFRLQHLYGSQAEAKAAAEAKHGDLKRGQKSIQLEMEGNPKLFAEALVKLAGFDEDVDGEFLAKSVTHTFARSGYRTTAMLETEGGA